jgi:hypothetical protein
MTSKHGSVKKKSKSDFQAAFLGLKKILKIYEPNLHAKTDSNISYYLETRQPGPNGKPQFFGAAIIKKNYVSLHLMALYCFPELCKEISPGLKKHIQGKACFNFTAPEPELFLEIQELASAGRDKFREQRQS